jgi:hypothetical protein
MSELEALKPVWRSKELSWRTYVVSEEFVCGVSFWRYFFVVYTRRARSSRNALTLNGISDLIKNGPVESDRPVVEERGVGFELDDRRGRLTRWRETVLADEENVRRTPKRDSRHDDSEEEARQREKEAKREGKNSSKPRQQSDQTFATAASLLLEAQASREPARDDAEAGEVSGKWLTIQVTLRDVRLQILYSWQWKNEYQPGKDDRERPFTMS